MKVRGGEIEALRPASWRCRGVGSIKICVAEDFSEQDLSLLSHLTGHTLKKYKKEQSHSDRASYAQAEIDARTRRIGLRVDANPISLR